MIDRNSNLPYYLQIKEYLLSGIKDGTFPIGSKIPSESELTQTFGVSRITVRQAIEALTQEGFVKKTQGKGTFVRSPKVTQELNVITSWTETMLSRGMLPETRAFSYLEEPAGDQIAQLLGISPDEPVYALERLSYSGDEPISIRRNYLPVSVAPGLIKNDQIRSGLYHVLENTYGLVLATAVETIEARAASSREAEMLRIRRGAPVLRVQRVTSGPDGNPLEVAIVTSIANKYAYVVKLHGRPQKSAN